MSLKNSIILDKIPQHIAIIMDGNGRWAKQKGKLRVFGHKSGVKSVQKITQSCAELGVKYLTLYAFSTENWNRPKQEVKALMELLSGTINSEIKVLIENNIRLNIIGNINKLPKEIVKKLDEAIKKTSENTGLTLTLALSYSSKNEIVEAVKSMMEDVKNNKILDIKNIDEQTFDKYLFTKDMPNPDLLIRTGGEKRISNFLLWQVAYSELYFTEIFWPDFTSEELYKAIVDYQQRERRFGKISEQIN